MKKKLLLSGLMLTILLASCASTGSSSSSLTGSSSASEDSSSSSSLSDSSSSSSSESTSSSEMKDGRVQTYYYQPNQSDFNGAQYNTTAGVTDPILGLSWEYDKFAFLGQSDDGIQIGSNAAPQVDPWTIKTTFPGEVQLQSFTLSIKSPRAATFKVEADDYIYEADMTVGDKVEQYTVENINKPTTTFSLTLQGTTKAIYFYSLEMTLFVPDELGLDFDGDSTLTPVVPGENGVLETNYPAISKEEYYKDIDFDVDDLTLENSLSALISDMTRISYGDDTYAILYTDESIEKPGTIYGVYDGDLLKAENTGLWNKEHIWPCSRMNLADRPGGEDKNQGTDLHNLRVSCQSSNGKHGNLFFDEANVETTFFPNIPSNGSHNHAFEGDFRGDVARICFYMALRYTFLQLIDETDSTDSVSMGKLSTLLKWNEEDPVDAFETQRNNRIYEYQGNRNPFIDYPELAGRIYA